LRLPVIGSPLFIASGPDLVKAQCQAGVIGSFPALNARPAELLDEWLRDITASNLAFAEEHPGSPVAPFAVNQIVHRSNDRISQDMDVIVEHRVPLVITSLGARPEVNDAVHSYGGMVLHDVVSNEYAKKAIDKGADGIVAVAAGAGGHAGTQSPFALVQEIREWFDGPIALSGSIAHGRSIIAALAAGADFAYVGSAFLSTVEANAAPDYKQMVLDSSAQDIVYSNLFTGVHGNYLRGSIVQSGLDPDHLETSDPSEMRIGSDVKAWRDVWGSGQGIGPLRQLRTTRELIDVFVEQFEAARERFDSMMNRVSSSLS
jgi:nitronate monooxygenase